MSKPEFTLLVLIGVIFVALADVCLKRASEAGSLSAAMLSPWLWVGVVLYLVQIGIFVMMFVRGWSLSMAGSVQTVAYALVTLTAGVLFFGEELQVRQVVGWLLGVIGVVLVTA